MRLGRVELGGCLLALALAACGQGPGGLPMVERVTPGLLGAGQERYVRIDGHFLPHLQWRPGQDPEVSVELEVRVAGQRASDVQRVSASSLLARIPAISEPGCYDVTVTRGGGLEGRLADGLCVSLAPVERVHGCWSQEARPVPSLCATDPLGQVRVLVRDVVTAVSEESGLFQTDDTSPGYRVSPDGKLVAFLRIVPDEPAGPQWERIELRVARLEEPAWEVLVASAPQPADRLHPATAGLRYFGLSGLVFSPDGAWLAWIQNQIELYVARVPGGPGPVPAPRRLAGVEPNSGQQLMFPDIDPGTRWVLYTRVQSSRLEPGLEDEVDLHLVALDGEGAPQQVLAEEAGSIRNGPGAFHPNGRELVFVSDRLKMRILTPFLSMQAVLNLFAYDLRSREWTALTAPTAGFWLGRPVLSPDGRWAANVGFIGDDSFTGLDLFLTELDTGRLQRLGVDGGPFCGPPAADQCIQGALRGCCRQVGGQLQCCSLERPWLCPSWEQLASFGPDSRSLAATTLPLIWFCKDGGDQVWDLSYMDINILAGNLEPSGAWTGEVLSRQVYSLDTFAWAPGFRQVLRAP